MNLFIIHLLILLVIVAEDPYTQISVPKKVKKKLKSLKVFNLVSKVNKTWFAAQYESYECKFRLNGSTCNSK